MKLHRASLDAAPKEMGTGGKAAKARTAKATGGSTRGGGGGTRVTSAPRGGKARPLTATQKRIVAHNVRQRKMGEKVAAGQRAAARAAAKKAMFQKTQARHADNARRGYVAPKPVVTPPVVKVGKPKKTRDAPKLIGGKKGRGRQEKKPLVTKNWRFAAWEAGKNGENKRGHDFWVKMGVDKALHGVLKNVAKESGVMEYVLGDPPGTGVLQKWVDKQWEQGGNPYIFDANAKGFNDYAEAYKKARPAIDLKMVKAMLKSYAKETGKPISAKAMRILLNENTYKMVYGQDGKVK